MLFFGGSEGGQFFESQLVLLKLILAVATAEGNEDGALGSVQLAILLIEA